MVLRPWAGRLLKDSPSGREQGWEREGMGVGTRQEGVVFKAHRKPGVNTCTGGL